MKERKERHLPSTWHDLPLTQILDVHEADDPLRWLSIPLGNDSERLTSPSCFKPFFWFLPLSTFRRIALKKKKKKLIRRRSPSMAPHSLPPFPVSSFPIISVAFLLLPSPTFELLPSASLPSELGEGTLVPHPSNGKRCYWQQRSRPYTCSLLL